MPEMLREFPTLVDVNDEAYVGQVWAREMTDARWEAWIVFVPVAAGQPRRTDRDTIQANRAGVEYWSSGLTPIYLEGAFSRSRPVRVSA